MTDDTIPQGGYHNELFKRTRNLGNTSYPVNNFILPVFVLADPDAEDPIESVPGQSRFGVNKLVAHLKRFVAKGLSGVLLFGVVPKEKKDDTGSYAEDPNNPVIAAIKALRDNFKDLIIACDVCLCPYTSHGHCGVLSKDGVIDNDASIKRLTDIAMTYAKAGNTYIIDYHLGCHIVAPSDMMDGRVASIKAALRGSPSTSRVSILSYSAKFASAFYHPFRDAVKSSPSSGDRQSYQIPPGSQGLAMRAVDRDVAEGADILMVKPGLPYLDVVKSVKSKYPNHPLAVYQTSGECAMMYAAAESYALELRDTILEMNASLSRAGPDVIITYFADALVEVLSSP